MEHSEDKIEHAIVIAYAFMTYSLKCGLKELGKKGETEVTEKLYQIHTRETFFLNQTKT